MEPDWPFPSYHKFDQLGLHQQPYNPDLPFDISKRLLFLYRTATDRGHFARNHFHFS